HGERGARLAAESHTAAIATIQRIVEEEKIDCDFKRLDGYLFLDPGDSSKVLEEEFEAARSAGIDVIFQQNLPLSLTKTPCLRFPRQAQFHAGRYIAGLAAAAKKAGVNLFGNTEVTGIANAGTPKIKTRDRKSVSAAFAVVASNTPFIDRV